MGAFRLHEDRLNRTELVPHRLMEGDAAVSQSRLCRHSEFRAPQRILFVAFAVASLAVNSSGADEYGRVRGRVRFQGEVPKSATTDETGRKRPLFEVHPQTLGLRNAVVYWIDAPADVSPNDAQDLPVVVVDQKDSIFLPHVVSVRSGQPVKFTNSDSVNHNVRTTAFEAKNQFNVYTTSGHEYLHRFVTDKKQRPTRLGCDIHPWMSGWIFAFDHPHHAVTDAEGRFELPHLPAGKQRLAIRQPDGQARRDVTVEVVAGTTTTLDVIFRDADLLR